jgi:hypothetical protein
MAKERKAYAPFSLTSEAGVAQTPVEGYIDVRQEIYPTVSTGTINEDGKWAGVKSDDTEFFGFTKGVAIGGGGSLMVAPDTNNVPSLDMTGFTDLFIAIKPTAGGAYAISAIMGPDTIRFANLEPVAAGATLRGNVDPRSSSIDHLLSDAAETLTADVWNIFYTGVGRLANQKNLQIQIQNNSGSTSDIEVAFMRLV